MRNIVSKFALLLSFAPLARVHFRAEAQHAAIDINPAAAQTVNQAAATTLSGSAPNGVANASLFPGADIGAKINAAIASLPGNFRSGSYGCGTVVLPTTSSNSFVWFSTPIIKPQCTTIDLGGGTIGYNGPAAYPAITVEDSYASIPMRGGIKNGIITGSGAGSGPITPGSIGVFLGGAATVQTGHCTYTNPNTCLAALQTFDNVEVIGFANGWELGSNTFDNVWLNDQIAANTVGLHVIPGGHSNENQLFVGTHFFQNVGYDIVVDPAAFAEINCDSCSFNYAGVESISGPIHFNSINSHFEDTVEGLHWIDCHLGGCSISVKGGSVDLLQTLTPADSVGLFGGTGNTATFDSVEYGIKIGNTLSQFNIWNDSSPSSSLHFTNFRQDLGQGLSNTSLASVPAYTTTTGSPSNFFSDPQTVNTTTVANGPVVIAGGATVLDGVFTITYTGGSGSATMIVAVGARQSDTTEYALNVLSNYSYNAWNGSTDQNIVNPRVVMDATGLPQLVVTLQGVSAGALSVQRTANATNSLNNVQLLSGAFVGTTAISHAYGIIQDSRGNVTLPAGVLGPATAPSGDCTANGAWVFSQDGHATFCANGVWTTRI